jgi:hypothetical protein
MTAAKTLEATTQMGTISTAYPLRQHMKPRFSMYGVNRINDTVYTDTIFSSVPAINGGETKAQVFVIGKKNFVIAIPMKYENEAPEAFKEFIMNYGAPNRIHSDNAKVETGIEWIQIRRKFYIKGTETEPYHPEQNYCERVIEMLKRKANYLMDKSGANEKFWKYAITAAADNINHTAFKSINWRTPWEAVMGETPDISPLLNFKFFEKIVYLDTPYSFPESKEKPGRVLTRALNVGDAMTYNIVTENGTVIQRSVMRSVEEEEDLNRRIQHDTLDNVIETKVSPEFNEYIPYIRKHSYPDEEENEIQEEILNKKPKINGDIFNQEDNLTFYEPTTKEILGEK